MFELRADTTFETPPAGGSPWSGRFAHKTLSSDILAGAIKAYSKGSLFFAKPHPRRTCAGAARRFCRPARPGKIFSGRFRFSRFWPVYSGKDKLRRVIPRGGKPLTGGLRRTKSFASRGARDLRKDSVSAILVSVESQDSADRFCRVPLPFGNRQVQNGKKSKENPRHRARPRLAFFPRRLAVPQTEGIEGALFLPRAGDGVRGGKEEDMDFYV